jgi:hypothetical protein
MVDDGANLRKEPQKESIDSEGGLEKVRTLLVAQAHA